jgi:hypothetical protein
MAKRHVILVQESLVTAHPYCNSAGKHLLTLRLCGVLQVDILFCYFGIRKFATHWVSLGFFCMLVPLSTFTPEVRFVNSGITGSCLMPTESCTDCLLDDMSRWHVEAVAPQNQP